MGDTDTGGPLVFVVVYSYAVDRELTDVDMDVAIRYLKCC